MLRQVEKYMRVAVNSMGNLLGTISAKALLRLRPAMASDEHDFSGRRAAILVLAEDKGTGIKPQQKSCSLHNKAGSRVCEGFGVQRCLGSVMSCVTCPLCLVES